MNDDLISRQAAIEEFYQYPNVNWTSLDVMEKINELPPAQTERKRGEWIDEPVYKQTMDGKTWDGFTYCSECKEMHEYGYRSNYCPNCGAQMDERRE